MQDNLLFYRLSGKIGPMGLIWGVALGTVVAFPLSFVYAYAVRYIPLIYLNFIISFGYVAIVGWVYGFAERLGNNRNRLASFLGTLVMWALCLYLSWVAFLFVLYSHEINYFKILLNPSDVWYAIQQLAEKGWFSIGSSKDIVKGFIYAVCLVTEALGYLLITVSLGMLSKKNIFCENCTKWITAHRLPIAIDVKLEPQIQQTASTGLMDWQNQLETSQNPNCSIFFTMASCSDCNELDVLSAIKVQTIKEKDKTDTKETGLFQNLMLDKKAKDDLLEKLEELQKQEISSGNKATEKPDSSKPPVQ